MLRWICCLSLLACTEGGGGDSADGGTPRTMDLGPAQADAGADLGEALEDAGALLDASDGLPRDAAADAALPPLDAGSDAGVPVCPEPEPELLERRPEGEGRYRRFRQVSGANLLPRDVRVYLPPDYEGSGLDYPVLYMHDGQNLFSDAEAAFGVEWGVDETLDGLAERGMRPWIVVALDNTPQRLADYSFEADPDYAGGNGEAYADLLVDTVVPLIDAHFRTLCAAEHRALAGSSMGGLISLQIGLRNPEVFGRLGVLSPSLFWNGHSVIDALAQHAGPRPLRLWMDGGTLEGEVGLGFSSLVRDLRRAVAAARAQGFVFGRDLAGLEDEGARHDEPAWAARLPAVFEWLLGDAVIEEGEAEALTLRSFAAGLPVGGRAALSVEAQLPGAPRVTVPADLAGLHSLDPELARVEEGEVLALAEGRATLAAEWKGQSAETQIVIGGGARLDFVVEVPAGTPEGEGVYVTGDHAALGPWDPAGLALAQRDGRWRGSLLAAPGTVIEFKFTRGDWETVEKGAGGEELENRRFRLDGDEVLEARVLRWADSE